MADDFIYAGIEPHTNPRQMRNLHTEMLKQVKGFMSQNKFEVILSRPKGLPMHLKDDVKRMAFNDNGDDLKDEQVSSDMITIMAQSVTLPNKSFKTFTTYQNIAPNERPYQIVYAPLVITFLLDSDGIVYDWLWRWFNTVYSTHTNAFNYYDEFKADIKIKAYDNYGMLLLEIDYIDAYPSIQNEQIFDTKIVNNAQSMPITFQYKKVKVENYGDSVYRYGYGDLPKYQF